MPLSVGDKIGSYEIFAPLGKGGMGEVYRARDAKLGRDVAIKVLPAALANDPARLARFEREAKVLAALNHPNIAAIYGLEDRAIVMELVEGPTLEDRLSSGPLPLEETVRIATQIAEALEAAHEKGIVHRDLKPANVKAPVDAPVKVLDLGLATALPGSDREPGDAENSPTLTMGGTEAGVIMGTAAYMSPEQASGKRVDKRADIWSYGVVLWEMLTGRRLFEGGETLSHTLADVLRAPIDFSKVQAPPRILDLLKRCLDRNPKTRLRDIGEARVALAGPLEGPTHTTTAPPASTGASSKIAWIAAIAAIAAAAVLGWRLLSPAPLPDRPMIRLSVDLGPEATRGERLSVLVSPDGTRIVYTGHASGGLTQLYTRRLDQSSPVVVSGTNFLDPSMFFSPDGASFGFVDVDRKIRKVGIQGGSPVALGSTNGAPIEGASWGDDDNIILGTASGLLRMPAAGGSPEPVSKQPTLAVFPQVLPGSRVVLFNSLQRPGMMSDEDLDIATMDLHSGAIKWLVHQGYYPRYLPTYGKSGHLVYMHEGTLFGVAFDPNTQTLRGTPVALLDDVAASPNINDGGGQFSFDRNGTFVYLSGRARQVSFPISWLDSAGKVTPLPLGAGIYGAPRVSPDGKSLAYIAQDSKGFNVWVFDLNRATPTQVTFSGAFDEEIAWARDSKHVVCGDGSALWWIRSDGAGQPQMLADKMQNPRPGSMAPDGRLAFSAASDTLPDVLTLPIDLTDPEHPKAGKPEPFLADPAIVEVDPAFSPDGKFIAYASNESGDEEVFVRPFPGPGGKWKVSTKGGKFPAWSPAAHELLFLGNDDRVMAARYTISGSAFTSETPRTWSPTPIRRNNVQQSFDVSPDGKRVVMFPPAAAEGAGGTLHATFLLNFFDEVRRRAPAKQ